MKHYLFLIMLSVLTSCKTKENQYVKISDSQQQRHGKWREIDKIDDNQFVSKGKYNRGEKVGVWKTYLNGNILQKDRIKDSLTLTKIYYPNGKKKVKGQSKITITDDYSHWRYSGYWKYFDEAGNLLYVKKHRDNGKVDSISYVK